MKFKKGDRVIVNDEICGWIFGVDLIGAVGTVLEYHENTDLYVDDNAVGIEFDEYINGHDCGHCWWVLESCCELLEHESLEEKEESNYYTGKVVCVEDGMDLVNVGRLFNVVDGVAKYKDVNLTKTPITSVDDLNSRFKHITFIEVIE